MISECLLDIDAALEETEELLRTLLEKHQV